MGGRRNLVAAAAACAVVGSLTLQPPTDAAPRVGGDTRARPGGQRADAPVGNLLRVGTARHRFVPGRDNQGMIVHGQDEDHSSVTFYGGQRGR